MKKLWLSWSSGLDSTTLLYYASKVDKFDVIQPVCFVYDDRSKLESLNALSFYEAVINKELPNVEKPLIIDLTPLLPCNLLPQIKEKIKQINSDLTHYIPSRNLLFTVFLSTLAEYEALSTKTTDEIYIGLGIHRHVTYTEYWDITPNFVRQLQKLLSLNNMVTVKLYTPFVDKTKKEIIELSVQLEVPHDRTLTCYTPIIVDRGDRYIVIPCKKCKACVEREKLSTIEGINDYKLIVKKR